VTDPTTASLERVGAVFDRLQTIADEACGLGPITVPDENLTRIEHELFAQRKQISDLERELDATKRERETMARQLNAIQAEDNRLVEEWRKRTPDENTFTTRGEVVAWLLAGWEAMRVKVAKLEARDAFVMRERLETLRKFLALGPDHDPVAFVIDFIEKTRHGNLLVAADLVAQIKALRAEISWLRA
jgi:hypothetical protein